MIPVLGMVNVSRPDAPSSQSHRAEGTASAQPATTPLPLFVLPPHPQRVVVSTEVAYGFCEQRGGEIRSSNLQLIKQGIKRGEQAGGAEASPR